MERAAGPCPGDPADQRTTADQETRRTRRSEWPGRWVGGCVWRIWHRFSAPVLVWSALATRSCPVCRHPHDSIILTTSEGSYKHPKAPRCEQIQGRSASPRAAGVCGPFRGGEGGRNGMKAADPAQPREAAGFGAGRRIVVGLGREDRRRGRAPGGRIRRRGRRSPNFEQVETTRLSMGLADRGSAVIERVRAARRKER